MSLAGALKFGRYAFAPNQLGYCGPDDNESLFDYVTEKRPDQGLVELERRFEGAYPYLCLIAGANGIADPFDQRVVDAYWIGNDLLNGVGHGAMYESLSDRFRPRMKSTDFRWLTAKLGAARPHHNFHVFDIYVRTGLMRDEKARVALGAMDSCRVSWGKVMGVEGPDLIVERPELTYMDGRLGLSEPRVTRVTRQHEGRGFIDEAKLGDMVSVHWSWACDRLTPDALRRLRQATDQCLALANMTI
ncbi:MAG: DUF6390 family protein [Candidatus Dormiibacterota bacterium]